VIAPDATRQTLRATIDPNTKEAIAVYRNTNQPGLYGVDCPPQFSDAGAFAVNLDIQESDLTAVDLDQIRAAVGNHPVRFVNQGPTDLAGWPSAQRHAPSDQPRHYGPWLLLAAFFVFPVETFLANRFTQRGQASRLPTTEYLATRRTESTVRSRAG
jgi:hypothetical protein